MTYDDIEYVQAHCDSRILHDPEDGCDYCNEHPLVQQLRVERGVAFTGHDPVAGQRPCPADLACPPGSSSDHRKWGGNRPTSSYVDPNWPEETMGSLVMYGDPAERHGAFPQLVRNVVHSLREIVRNL